MGVLDEKQITVNQLLESKFRELRIIGNDIQTGIKLHGYDIKKIVYANDTSFGQRKIPDSVLVWLSIKGEVPESVYKKKGMSFPNIFNSRVTLNYKEDGTCCFTWTIDVNVKMKVEVTNTTWFTLEDLLLNSNKVDQ